MSDKRQRHLPQVTEQGRKWFNPRLCPAASCSEIQTECNEYDGYYECSVCGYGGYREYEFPVNEGLKRRRVDSTIEIHGGAIAKEVVSVIHPNEGRDPSTPITRFCDKTYDSDELTRIAIAIKKLHDVVNALLSHTSTIGVQINDNCQTDKVRVAKQMREAYRCLVTQCPLVANNAIVLLSQQMIDGNVSDFSILGWAMNNFAMFMSERGRNLRMMAALQEWHDAQAHLMAQCSFTKLCNDFVHVLSESSFTSSLIGILPIIVSRTK